MMDTPIYGLMGVSTCNEKDEWEYYVAVASTKETNEYEEFVRFAFNMGCFLRRRTCNQNARVRNQNRDRMVTNKRV